jgi:hypothetical protein
MLQCFYFFEGILRIEANSMSLLRFMKVQSLSVHSINGIRWGQDGHKRMQYWKNVTFELGYSVKEVEEHHIKLYESRNVVKSLEAFGWNSIIKK